MNDYGCFASEETKNQNRKSEKAKVLKSYIFSKLSFVIWPGRNELFFKLLRSFKKRSIHAKNLHSLKQLNHSDRMTFWKNVNIQPFFDQFYREKNSTLWTIQKNQFLFVTSPVMHSIFYTSLYGTYTDTHTLQNETNYKNQKLTHSFILQFTNCKELNSRVTFNFCCCYYASHY